jgi:hypothetical protein
MDSSSGGRCGVVVEVEVASPEMVVAGSVDSPAAPVEDVVGSVVVVVTSSASEVQAATSTAVATSRRRKARLTSSIVPGIGV